MTREETIKWLESLKAEIGKSEHRILWHYAEAIDMAIEALKAQDRPIICPRCGRTFTQPEGNPWWIVYRELSGNRLLMGHYDARNGASEHFMYGIGTVMESIAVRCGMQEQWNNEFYANMAESEGKKDR